MPKLYDVHEVAQTWGLCDDTIRDLIKAGKLRAISIGNRYRITQEAIDEFLAAAAVEAEASR